MQPVEPHAKGELPTAQRSLYLMLNFSKNCFSLELAVETSVKSRRIFPGVTIAAGEIKIKPGRLTGEAPRRTETQVDIYMTRTEPTLVLTLNPKLFKLNVWDSTIQNIAVLCMLRQCHGKVLCRTKKWHLLLFLLKPKHTTPTARKRKEVSMDFHYRNLTNQFLTCKTDQVWRKYSNFKQNCSGTTHQSCSTSLHIENTP